MSDNNIVSVELGEKHIRIADSVARGKKIELLSLGYEEGLKELLVAETDAGLEKSAAVIGKLFESLKIKKRAINVIIPDNYTFSQVIEMPKLNEKELLSAIRYQADQFVPMPIEEITLDIETLKEDAVQRKLELLIVAAPKKVAKAVEKLIEKAGLIPASLENELSAIARYCGQFNQSAASGSYLVVNLGYNNSSLYLFDNANQLLANRTIKLGVSLFIKDILVNLSLENEKKVWDTLQQIGFSDTASVNLYNIVAPLMKELNGHIEKFILLAKDKYRLAVTEIRLCNYGETIAHLDTKLGQTFGLSVSPLLKPEMVVDNPVATAFKAELNHFVSVIGGNLR
ncbi:pilus assembly protein PilM [Patescibacteria group bacterium]|nr:pilus assembly protein PilM [Patescibacteria group bacterium]MCL5091867.1 pilus assembly protein PilM [Patescibacteria group bacterium]